MRGGIFLSLAILADMIARDTALVESKAATTKIRRQARGWRIIVRER